jgi:hypothetical protein
MDSIAGGYSATVVRFRAGRCNQRGRRCEIILEYKQGFAGNRAMSRAMTTMFPLVLALTFGAVAAGQASPLGSGAESSRAAVSAIVECDGAGSPGSHTGCMSLRCGLADLSSPQRSVGPTFPMACRQTA